MIDKQKIEKQAKEILDKFAKALEEVEGKSDKEFYVDRNEFEREEGEGEECSDFKKQLLKNAPEHDDDFIIAEKGGWK